MKLIMLSSIDVDALKTAEDKSLFDMHLTKPVRQSELLNCLNSVIANDRLPQAAPSTAARPVKTQPKPAITANVAQAEPVSFDWVTVGDPADESVRMGPLATRRQLDDARAGLMALGGGTSMFQPSSS